MAQSDCSASHPKPEALVCRKERRLNGEDFMAESRDVEKFFGVDEDVAKVRPKLQIRATLGRLQVVELPKLSHGFR